MLGPPSMQKGRLPELPHLFFVRRREVKTAKPYCSQATHTSFPEYAFLFAYGHPLRCSKALRWTKVHPALLQRILIEYADRFSSDFGRLRQDEARFELSVKDALITGAIDLLLKEEPERGITTADVIDFKTMELPDDSIDYDWRDMSIQVQLYSKAAKEIMGENVETGYIHTLKDNKRTAIPVDESSVEKAIKAIEWAVSGILSNDFPMRPCKTNCDRCDFKAMCARKKQPFARRDTPPTISTPTGEKIIAAYDMEGDDDGN